MKFEKKKSKLKIAQQTTEEAIKNTNVKIEVLGYYTSDLYTELNNIQEVFDEIRNIPSDKKEEYEGYKEIRLKWKQEAEKIENDYKVAQAKGVGAGAAGAAAGVAVIVMGPTAAMGIATTFGVASTGTAIATLNGAAATNAALAWLGGGAIAAGGGGMAAGEGFLALAGPIGWAIAGVALITSGLLIWKNVIDKKHLDDVFALIGKRDVASYNLAIVEINERIQRIVDETKKLVVATEHIKSFGFDYKKMTEAQQYELGAYVNLMNSSTQLLVNPILGLQPEYSETDFDEFINWNERQSDKELCMNNKKMIIYLSNLLFEINLNDRDKKLLWKSIKNNKKLRETMEISKKDLKIEVIDAVFEGLNYKCRSC